MGIGVINGAIVAGSGVTLMTRLQGNNGQLVTKASLASISYQVSNLTLGTVAGTGTLAVASVIFDSLQQSDPRWTADSADSRDKFGNWGYNFLATLPAAAFGVSTLVAQPLAPVPPPVYQIDVLFTPASGEVFRVPFRAQAYPVFA